jgi:enediyne biosynthesis protein E4
MGLESAPMRTGLRRRARIAAIRRRMRIAASIAVLAGLGGACQRTAGLDDHWFTDATAASGLAFTHHNGRTGQFYYPEVIAPGAALFDADGDGDLDLVLIQSRDFTSNGAASPAPQSRFFRNDLQVAPDGTRTLRFTDVTEQSGLAPSGYGMGVAAGDVDNDGCVDLLTTSLQGSRLFHNDCRGVFTDISSRSGLATTGWNVSASFVDFDRDGWLDLFVGHYLIWDLSLNTPCYGTSGRRVYCAPQVYRAQQSRLYRNSRDGTFADVTDAAGLATQYGPALGVSTADFDGDGWIDIYVANDREENQLWINRRNGTFENRGLLSGTALGPFGEAKSGMGVDAGDIDDDGDEDLIVTNLTGEGNDLYVNDGTGTFVNASAVSGIGHRSLPYTGFGVGWLDVDNDGLLDLLAVNGAVQIPDSGSDGATASLGQLNSLFRNLGNRRFEEVTATIGGPGLQRRDASRGAAFGDVDNDGDTDVVVANNGGAAQLLLNAVGQRRHWVGLRLRSAAGVGALGARVAVTTTNGPTRWRRARADGSYASANDPRVIVGLADNSGPVSVRVIWPGGRSEQWARVEIDRYTTLTEGGGTP